MHEGTTIAAISSPPGPARRGVLRLSGPDARRIANAALVEPALEPDTPRGPVRARLDDGGGTQPVLLLWMPGPHSYTREDVVELHLVGAAPLLSRALQRLLTLGARPAAPGEFTRRAFLAGRIDLTQAEGVLELVQASGEAERRAATHLLGGGLERRVAALREELDDLRSLVEASLDFDQEDTGHVPTEELLARLDAAAARLDAALGWEVARQPPSALPRVVLFGAPNAGKSSLFNLLVGGQALVSELAGTTRDTLRAIWDVGVTPVLLVDLAGLDAGARGPDATAQALAAGELAGADLVLWVVDARTGVAPDRERARLPEGVPVVGVWSQVDRADARPAPDPRWSATSTVDGRGLDGLRAAVRTALGWDDERDAPARDAAPSIGRELFLRHRHALEQARARLGDARDELRGGAALDLVAETLRGAGGALDAISGRTLPEDLLDRIFARFCLGK